MGQSKAVCEWIVEAFGAPRRRRDAVRRRPLRQRARLVGLRDPDLPPPDRARRAAHRHPPGDDALLHDDPRGGRARRPGRGDRRPRPDLRARHGRAGPDPRPRAQDDPALGQGARARHRDRLHRRAPRREAARGAVRRGRDLEADRRTRRSSPSDVSPVDRALAGRASWASWSALVDGGRHARARRPARRDRARAAGGWRRAPQPRRPPPSPSSPSRARDLQQRRAGHPHAGR